MGTGDVAPVSPAQVQKSTRSSAFGPLSIAQHARTCVRVRCLVRAAREFASALHQLDRASFATSRRITTTFLSRPSQSDSRVVAHNKRVAGNGCHTASSTRTSPGVPALQGLTPSILHSPFWLSPLRPASACGRGPDFAGAPFSCFIRRCCPCLRTFGPFRLVISRFRSTGVAAELLGSFELCRVGSRKPVRVQPLPPELPALVQLPVPRWLSRPDMCRVTVTFPGAVRSALPPRWPLRCAFCGMPFEGRAASGLPV